MSSPSFSPARHTRDASSSGWFSRSERHREAEGDADREEPIWRAARQAPTNARIEKHVRWRRLPDEADEWRVVAALTCDALPGNFPHAPEPRQDRQLAD